MSKELCDINCNECEVIQNKQVALLLNVLALRFGEEIWWITNRICPNLTCCPICHIDDFCHDYCNASDKSMDSGICAINELGKKSDGYETCEVAEEAMKVFEAIEKEKKEFQSANQRLN